MKLTATQIVVLLLCLSTAVLVQGKDFWVQKDYREWSEKECRKLLQNSPWTRLYTIADHVIEPLETERTDRGREMDPRVFYQVQFRSALPIRQAEVRMAQIQMNYEQLPPESQTSFDQQAEQYVNAPFPESVTVHVSFGSNVPIYDRELLQYWQKMSLDQVKNLAYLIGADRVRVQPVGFELGPAGRQEFFLTFPRQYEDEPLVGPKDKRISLEFEHPAIGELGARRVYVEFPVKKMVIDGIVVY